MSILFQALERAAREGRLRPDPFPYPLGRPASKSRRIGLSLAAILVLVTGGFAAGWVADHAVLPSFPSISAPAAPSVAEPARDEAAKPGDETPRAVLDLKDADAVQGIVLSSPMSAAAVPVKDMAPTPARKPEEAIPVKKVEEQVVQPPKPAKKADRRKIQVEVKDTVPPDLLKKAQDAAASGSYATALGLYNKALEAAPEHDGALSGKAFVLAQLDRPVEAASLWQKLAEQNPTDLSIQTHWVEALALAGTDEAEARLKKIAEKQPSFAPGFAALAKIEIERNHPTEAVAAWRRAMDLEPRTLSYRLSLAVLYDRMEQGEAALPLYRQVLEMRDTAPALPLTWSAIERRILYLSGK